jgi:hypothetical protein
MPPAVNKREEGLRALAWLIAEAYRHQPDQAGGQPIACKSDACSCLDEADIVICFEPEFSETIKIDYFLSGKASKCRR